MIYRFSRRRGGGSKITVLKGEADVQRRVRGPELEVPVLPVLEEEVLRFVKVDDPKRQQALATHQK